MGTRSRLIATARMTESWGLILALSFSKGEQGSEPLHFGIFQPPISVKVVFPAAPDSSRCHQSPPCSEGGRMQWEAGRHPAPSWVPALCAGPGARSQNPAVGIWCVYLESSNDPGTARRMSQLPVQGRIPHQASQLKNHHLEMWQLNNIIKLALLTSDRLKPFHAGTFRAKCNGKQQSPQTIILQESPPKPQDLQALGG